MAWTEEPLYVDNTIIGIRKQYDCGCVITDFIGGGGNDDFCEDHDYGSF